MTTTVPINTVRCEAPGCATRIVAGEGAFCLRHQAEYEELAVTLESKRLHETLRNRTYGVPPQRASSPGTAFGEYARVFTGVARYTPRPQGEVCDASDFPTLLAGGSVGERVVLAAGVLATLGLGGLVGTLLYLGGRDLVGRILAVRG